MKLVSMTEFVLWLRGMTHSELQKEIPNYFPKIEWKGNKQEAVMDLLAHDGRLFKITGEYAKFLKKPLTIGMFVPVGNGNILEQDDYGFEEAKEKVLFKDVEWNSADWCDEDVLEFKIDGIYHIKYIVENKTFEDLIDDLQIKDIEGLLMYPTLELTESATKQITQAV